MPAPTPSGAFPPVRDRRVGWLTRRARNALRRRAMLATVAGGSFVVALLVLVALPRRAAVVPPPLPTIAAQRPDTVAALAAVRRAIAALGRAELGLAEARAALDRANAARAVVVTLAPAQEARRDSLQALVDELTRLLQNATRAPLPASYRALGESPTLGDTARVRALLDTLAGIERNREAFSLGGGTDPIFVALSARASDVGRELQDIAEARRAVLRREIQRLAPPPPVAGAPAVDTVPAAAAVARAAASLSAARAAESEARARARALEERATAVRRAQNASASPLAILAAALVLGGAVGYLVALAVEIRRPTISDPREAAAVAGVPLLVRAHEEILPPERSRRQADRMLPPLLHRASDTYRVLYAQLADARGNLPPIAILGDEPGVTAVVAANLAAAGARSAHTMLLVDADLAGGSISAVMRLRRSPGLSDVLERRVDWPGVLVSAPVGRDQSVDIVPAGVQGAALTGRERGALGEEIARMGRRYDAVVVSAPVGVEGAVPAAAGAVHGVALCVRTARTRLRALRSLVRALGQANIPVRGVIVWESPDPVLPPPAHAGV